MEWSLGNNYFSGSGYGGGGIKPKCRKTVRDFSKEADTLIIDYDYYLLGKLIMMTKVGIPIILKDISSIIK